VPKVEIIITGSELVSGRVGDVNGRLMATSLDGMGIPCQAIHVVGDDLGHLTHTIARALEAADLVLISGGLGPTGDDLTHQAVADASGCPLTPLPLTPGHQPAPTPQGATPIHNPKGSAAGIWLKLGGKALAALPGVPWELEAMWPEVVARIGAGFGSAGLTVSRTLRFVGLTEREVERRAMAALGDPPPPGLTLGVTAQPLAVDLHLKAAATGALETAVKRLIPTLGDHLYGEGTITLPQAVGGLFDRRGLVVACAESCTGGAISAALTSVSGASNYVDRGVVTYSNTAKTELLGVPEAMLETHGAVSEPVAVAMAEGLLARSRAGVALSVTGIAGPTGGTPEKPVGLVFMAVAGEDGTFCREFRHRGDRARVIERSVTRGLDLLRRYAQGGIAALEAHFTEADPGT